MTTTSSIITPQDQSDPEAPGFVENENEPSPTSGDNKVAEMGMLINDTDATKDSDGTELTFPESTHSFLFTEPITSFPFLFSLLIVTMSFACLIIALIDNIKHNEIPVNVASSVRAAQYMAIIIALLMEEEIPTALYLLKRISKPHLHSKFPEISYWKFVGSSILRFSLGYLFLANVIVILVRASNVLEIFYDVLALQFLQQLDDIAFNISKIEVLGKRMYLATMTPYFTTGFERQKDRLGIGRKIKFFLKGVYVVNLFVFLAVMIIVSYRQIRGHYHCPSYTVGIGRGDEVWAEAYVHYPKNSKQNPGGIEALPLLFSNFNGYYKLDESRGTREGRPIYVEQTKSDRTPFDTVVPKFNTSVFPFFQMDPIKPAEFKYCGGRWMLVHDYIKKSKHETDDTSDCGSWLLRSQPYDGFDLGGAFGWQIWEGEIVATDVSLSCNKCEENADCNLNGECNNGKCECNKEEGVLYLGEHCEVTLKDECHNITHTDKERGADKVIWSADSAATWIGEDGIFQEYSRPVYTYVEGFPPEHAPRGDDKLALVYSGSRYVIMRLAQARNNATSAYYKWQSKNHHGFWSRSFDRSFSYLISEPTDSDTPVGVDFYWVGERDDQYGPLGLLIPAFEVAGQGLFRCDVPKQKRCEFCSKGITVDPSFLIPETNGTISCGTFELISKTLVWTTEDEESYKICRNVTNAAELCCPEEWASSVNASVQAP